MNKKLPQENIHMNWPSVVGTNVPRVDALDKVLGRAQFTADLHHFFPNLLHVKVLRSPYPHARIVDIDISKAEQLAGVRLIITGHDYPAKVTWVAPRILASDEVTWAGQGVAAVAAESLRVAEEALDLIQVKYEELPALFDVENAMKSEVPSIVNETERLIPEKPNITGHYKMRAGDIEEGFAQADVILENKFSTSRISHAQLEPASCIARPEPDGGITLWTNGQGVHVIKAFICDLLQLPAAKVRIINPFQGGSFGNRLRFIVEPLAVILALKTKRTVEFTHSRQEMFLAAPTRLPQVVCIKTGAKRDGTIIAQHMSVIVDNGASYTAARDARAADALHSGRAGASAAICVYRIPNFFLDSYGVNTNTPLSGPFRGFGSPQVTWAVESQMDMLAEKLGMDPLELRRKNVLNRGEKNACGQTIESIGVMGCLEQVAREIKLQEPCTQESGPWRRGKGIAMGGKQNTPRGRSEAEVVVHDDGSIEALISCDDHGTGANTIMTQLVAEEFGVPIDRVKITRGDTSITPYDTFSASSFTVYNTGNAIRLACQDAIKQLLQAAAERMEIPPNDLILRNEKIISKEFPQSWIAISDLFEPFTIFADQRKTNLKRGTPVRGKGVFAPMPAIPWDKETGLTPRMWNWFQYNACGVEVAVNVETGQIKVLKAIVVADNGFPINPKMSEGQIEGGLCMGIGASLLEDYIYQNGLMANSSYGDYRIPTFQEMPSNKYLSVSFSVDPLPDGPWGAKGLGEGTMVSVAPAIANAVYNAVGTRIKDLPLTAERVLMSIRIKDQEARTSEDSIQKAQSGILGNVRNKEDVNRK